MNQIFLCLVAVAAIIGSVSADLCPGHQVSCRADQTCCRLAQGGYACCPYQLATCCSDGLHCCPHQTTCDTIHGRCLSAHPLLTKILSPTPEEVDDSDEDDNKLQLLELDNNEVNQNKRCPDGIQSCPESYTCCSLATGGYGCCPMNDGVCCADQIHCCPKGSICNVTGGTCDAAVTGE